MSSQHTLVTLFAIITRGIIALVVAILASCCIIFIFVLLIVIVIIIDYCRDYDLDVIEFPDEIGVEELMRTVAILWRDYGCSHLSY